MIYSKMPTANESAELVLRIRKEDVVIRERIVREEIISGIKKPQDKVITIIIQKCLHFTLL